tara:strand:+ start:260 stop:598 length:339 start_codon:yes stop_codon:yes gene_type:complete
MKKIIIFISIFLFCFSAQARTNWIKKDICKKEKTRIDLCKYVGKNIYRYVPAAKRSFNMGKIEGVVFLKKGQNKGTNYKRAAEKTGHYVLMNDTGDIKNLIPVFPDSTISFK